jgi:hypothetical protein
LSCGLRRESGQGEGWPKEGEKEMLRYMGVGKLPELSRNTFVKIFEKDENSGTKNVCQEVGCMSPRVLLTLDVFQKPIVSSSFNKSNLNIRSGGTI